MAKSNDKIDPAAAEDNLLNALESIKSLLEQSETKLTAARESISRANQPRKDAMPAKQKNNEPVVPILDDIVEPENYELPLESEEQEVAETQQTDVSDVMDQAMLDYLDALQASLEKNVRNTLMRTVVNIEKEVKKTINEQLDILRQQIRNKKD